MKTKTMIRSFLLAALALVAVALSVPGEAEAAAGTGTLTIGNLKFDYYTDGTTAIKVQVGATVYVYAVLTSAQTTDLREVYTTVPTLAAGGQTPAAVDGTPTLPGCAPSLGDMTD